jgi:class 3 adenylate cyclase
LATPERHSGTVTFLFTDIEGSTALLKRLGREQYGELLAQQKEIVREALAAHGGDEIDNQGDSFFAAFRSARDALLAAVSIQRALADHEWPEGAQVLVRVGIHSGEAAAAAERYVGISVHRAARIGAIAHGGQILVSESTRALVEDDLPEGLFLRDLGLWKLKDIDRPRAGCPSSRPRGSRSTSRRSAGRSP